MVCEVDPAEAETKVGPLVKLSVELLASCSGVYSRYFRKSLSFFNTKAITQVESRSSAG